jgi:hypothetical protein
MGAANLFLCAVVSDGWSAVWLTISIFPDLSVALTVSSSEDRYEATCSCDSAALFTAAG